MGRAAMSKRQHGLGEARKRERLSIGRPLSGEELGGSGHVMLDDGVGPRAGPGTGATAAQCSAGHVPRPASDGSTPTADGFAEATDVSGPTSDGSTPAEIGSPAGARVSGSTPDGPTPRQTGSASWPSCTHGVCVTIDGPRRCFCPHVTGRSTLQRHAPWITVFLCGVGETARVCRT